VKKRVTLSSTTLSSKAEEGEGKLRFYYLLRPGVSSQRLGMRVPREEGVFDLLDRSLKSI
jgi:DNA mismatch repair protein MutS